MHRNKNGVSSRSKSIDAISPFGRSIGRDSTVPDRFVGIIGYDIRSSVGFFTRFADVPINESVNIPTYDVLWKIPDDGGVDAMAVAIGKMRIKIVNFCDYDIRMRMMRPTAFKENNAILETWEPVKKKEMYSIVYARSSMSILVDLTNSAVLKTFVGGSSNIHLFSFAASRMSTSVFGTLTPADVALNFELDVDYNACLNETTKIGNTFTIQKYDNDDHMNNVGKRPLISVPLADLQPDDERYIGILFANTSGKVSMYGIRGDGSVRRDGWKFGGLEQYYRLQTPILASVGAQRNQTPLMCDIIAKSGAGFGLVCVDTTFLAGHVKMDVRSDVSVPKSIFMPISTEISQFNLIKPTKKYMVGGEGYVLDDPVSSAGPSLGGIGIAPLVIINGISVVVGIIQLAGAMVERYTESAERRADSSL